MVQADSDEAPAPTEHRPRGMQILAAYIIACATPVLMAFLYYRAAQTAGVSLGFPLDDSWIHAQYTRTIIDGRPFEYVTGERSIGTTSMLFDIVWAAATGITGEYIRTIHAVNILLTMGVAAVLVAFLLRYGLPALTAGAGAALIVATNPFGWSTLSGMETSLASLLTVAAVLAHVSWANRTGWRPLTGPALMALAAISRPENLILLPLSELDRLVMRWRDRDEPAQPGWLKRFILRVAVFFLALTPYFALNLYVHGSPVPNTYAAKIGPLGLMDSLKTEGISALGTGIEKAWVTAKDAFGFVFHLDNSLLLGLGVLGVAAIFAARLRSDPSQRWLLPLLAFAGGSAATGLLTFGTYFPGHFQRYLIQWIPLVLVFGVVGIDLVARGATAIIGQAPRVVYGIVIGGLVLADVIVLAYLYPKQESDYVFSVKNINEMQVALGRWVDENLPPDAIVATNDIGAIRFFGNRRIVDTIGLIDPHVVRIKHLPGAIEAMIAYLQERGVTHAVLFPRWHPDLVLDDRFRLLHIVRLDDNLICGDTRMIVLETDFNRDKKGQPEPDWAEKERANANMWRGLYGMSRP